MPETLYGEEATLLLKKTKAFHLEKTDKISKNPAQDLAGAPNFLPKLKNILGVCLPSFSKVARLD